MQIRIFDADPDPNVHFDAHPDQDSTLCFSYRKPYFYQMWTFFYPFCGSRHCPRSNLSMVQLHRYVQMHAVGTKKSQLRYSIFVCEGAHGLEWRRPHEMVEDPRLFVGGGDRFDINQVCLEIFQLAVNSDLNGC
jgi:hypothetical protein